MEDLEQEYSRTVKYLASHPENETHIPKEVMEYWLLNHSNTFFCNGTLRKVIFERITSKVFLTKSKEI